MTNRLAAAAHCGMEQECQVGTEGPDPHECKHLRANVRLDVQLVLGREGNLGGDADDGGDDGCNGEDDA